MQQPAGRMNVGSPSFTPLPYGLFSVVDEPTLESHWEMGVIHQPDACGTALTTLSPCPAPGGLTKAPSATGIPAMGADSFTVYAYIDCGPIGADLSEYEDRARQHLANGEERAVESVFWTGSVSTTGAPLIMPHLAEDVQVVSSNGEISQLAASPVTTGTGVDVVEALGLLEGALATCYGGVGVIHVPRVALAHLFHARLCYASGGKIYSYGGNLIAAGSGYPGTSPASGAPLAGQAWFYATGAVDLRRGPVRTVGTAAEAVDKINNQLVLLAERTYSLTWNCCLFAAQVRLGGYDSGAVGNAD